MAVNACSKDRQGMVQSRPHLVGCCNLEEKEIDDIVAAKEEREGIFSNSYKVFALLQQKSKAI